MPPLRPAVLPRLGVLRLPIRTLTTQPPPADTPPTSSSSSPASSDAPTESSPAKTDAFSVLEAVTAAPSLRFAKFSNKPVPIASNGSKVHIVIPPHATSYLPLPTPPQAEEPVPTRQRGYLPVPRNPFPKHEADRKVQERYYKKTTPAPLPKNVKHAAEDTRTAFKQVMAQTRRDSLREGLGALWERKHGMEEEETRRARARRARNDARVQRTRDQMRADSLTRPTIPEATLDTGVKPDPDRFQRAQSSRVKHRRRELDKMDARRDLIMDLYHNATSFIVTEAAYKAELDKIFSENYFQRWGSGDSVWDVWGPPPGMEDIMAGGTSPSAAARYSERSQAKSAQRLRVIGEELSGGKMV